MIVSETLDNLIASTELVVEGKVRSQQSFWDAERKNIYTVNEIEVFKVFKGITTVTTVNVVTQGGVVDLRMERVSNALELKVGEMGVFLLQNFLEDLPLTETLYRPKETVLGFIQYDLLTGTAHGVYESYANIISELYGQITAATGISIFDVGHWDPEDAELSGEPSIEKSIVAEQESIGNTTFEVHAGVSDLLTLTGADFGEEQGSISFSDANSGGRRFITALDNQVKEWTRDRIIVEVPYRAGTGKIRIDKTSGESLVSTEDILIGYDHINLTYTDVRGTNSYETQLISNNGKGGYDFQFETGFANNFGASHAFASLIETWSCTTGVNFQIGATTTVDEDASDGINIVRFDNGSELGGNTLAYARSRYRGCYQGETIKWFVDEIEVVVNDDYDWYYGDDTPAASQFDFETVMLHEIGHTLQLGHVINSNEVMHFAVGPQQQKRQLSNIDAIGGVFVIEKSTEEPVCLQNAMEYYNPCCETLMVVEQPSDQVVCADKNTAIFDFEVNFSDAWQWQERVGTLWVDLSDNARYAGTGTSQLIVNGPFVENTEFRCIARNACKENIVSSNAILSVFPIDFTVETVQADCEAEGQITIHRNQALGQLNISINGGVSYDYIWEEEEEKVLISTEPGSYSIWVQHGQSECRIDLGTFTLDEPVPLTLTAMAIEEVNCSSGKLKVSFNDHPEYEHVLLSIDGGTSFERLGDQMQSYVFENLTEGEYEILGMWEDNSCLTTSNRLTVSAPIFPKISVEEVQPGCSSTTGSLLLNFEPITDYPEIEFSLDGGLNYEYVFDSQIGKATIEELLEGKYELWARWGNQNCSIDLGDYFIKKNNFELGSCKAITVFLNESGLANISAQDVYDSTFEKGCPKVSLTLAQTTFSCDDLGENEVELTLTDENGATIVCAAIITVKDDLNFCSYKNNNEQELLLRIYPNPASESLQVQMSDKITILQFRLFTASGVVVKESFPTKPLDTYIADISYLPTGVYTVNITTESGEIYERIVIE